MAEIVATAVGSFVTEITETTLTGTDDTLEYAKSSGQVLVLRNDTEGALSPTIVGADADTVPVGGIGDVDVSSGYSVGSIAAGDVVSVRLDSISWYLAGEVSITDGAGLVAQLLAF